MESRVWPAFAALSSLIGVCLTAACHSRAVDARPGTPPERCGPAVPTSAQHPLTTPALRLAGDYDLIQVQTQPSAGRSSVGRLHLTPLDSVARAHAVGGAVRDLIGWLETAQGDTTWRPNAGSRNPSRPGAVLAGDHLRLGEWGREDSRAEHLMITAVSPEGFWGWWRAEAGWEVRRDPESERVLPDPAGYFCALRVQP